MKDKILSISFVGFLCLVLIVNILVSDKVISKSERRKLEQMPEVTIESVFDKSFMEEMDSYVLDQFVLRDGFRNIKANVSYNIFGKLDNNGIFVYDGYIFKSEYPTNRKSIDNFINKINNIGSYLTENNKVYYSIIPDKNYYLDSNKYLNVDYEYIYEEIKKINYEYIELRDVLKLDDYYRTDTHWKQENLCGVVNRLGEFLDFYTLCDYDKNIYDNFYGVYYGQSALKFNPDRIVYLTNEDILNSHVYYLENDKNNQVYIEENLEKMDSYDIYLDGSSSYIEIVNDKVLSDRELVIFRDSFSSSLAPLLIEYYSKITLIDIRYINSEMYLDKINFDNQDVLFLYSTLLVNNSYTLKD